MQLSIQPELHKQAAQSFFRQAIGMAVSYELLLSGLYTLLNLSVNTLRYDSAELISPADFLFAMVIVNIVTLPVGITTAVSIATRLYDEPHPVDWRAAARLGIKTAMIGYVVVLLLMHACTNPVMLWISAWPVYQAMRERMRVPTMFAVVMAIQLAALGIGELLVARAWLLYLNILGIPGLIYLAVAAWGAVRLNARLWLPETAERNQPELQS